jgi:DNA-binding HxlR family transcriptional regulator
MATKRTYDDGCGMAHALNLVGERWALLIVRELLLGPKRFTDLRVSLPKASPNVLAQRLRELEGTGIIRHRKLAPPAGSQIYELTEWGTGLEPAVLALGNWGIRSPLLNSDADVSADSIMLAARMFFAPGAGMHWNANYEVRLDDNVFTVRVADGPVEIVRGPAEAPDATIDTSPKTFGEVLNKKLPLSEATRDGRAKVIGDEDAAERLVDAVRIPKATNRQPA